MTKRPQNRVRKILKGKGWKQNDLADKMGISAENLSKMLTNNKMRTETLGKIAIILDVSFLDLFESEDRKIEVRKVIADFLKKEKSILEKEEQKIINRIASRKKPVSDKIIKDAERLNVIGLNLMYIDSLFDKEGNLIGSIKG